MFKQSFNDSFYLCFQKENSFNLKAEYSILLSNYYFKQKSR